MDNKLNLLGERSTNNLELLGVITANKLLLNMIAPVDYSNSLIVTSRGDGSGISQMRLNVSGTLTLTLDGNARFYTDAAATLGESTTTVFTTGVNVIYIRNSSGTSNLKFSDKRLLLGAGSVTGPGSGSGMWNPEPAGGDMSKMPTITCNNWDFPNCSQIAWFYGSMVLYTGNISIFIGMRKLTINGTGTITDTLSSIPANATIIGINMTSNLISGNVNTLPATLEQLNIGAGNTVSGDLAGFSTSLWYINISGNNTVSGDVKDFKEVITINIAGLNTITGDISTLDPSVRSFSLGGYNTVFGDISTFKTGVNDIYLGGNASTYGDIAYLPSTLTQLVVQSSNTITGDISTFKHGMIAVQIYGSNTLYGKVDDIHSTLQQFAIGGYNTIDGSINNIPSSIQVLGYNTVGGDVSTLRVPYTTIAGNNIIFGDINYLSSSLVQVDIRGNNTISGSMGANLLNKTSITNFNIWGNNTISGDLVNLPSNAVTIQLVGLNTVNTYTSGRVWTSNLYYFMFVPVSPGGLDSTEVDNLFIDMANTCISGGSIYVTGTNAAPTAASAAARATLISRGYSISIN